MNPRINVGKGVTGAVRYAFGQGRDPITGALKPAAANDDESRVAWIGGTGFSFKIQTEAHADLGRRIMEFDALNQRGLTRQCEKDCVHLTLAWRPGETPTRAEMEEAALDALKAVGMGNAKALFVAHDDEDYAHLHIVASKINPATGRAYDLKGSWRTLSVWAEGFEREHGGVVSVRRQDMNELRRAIADRDAGAVLEAMTKQRSTFTADQLERALQKEIQAGRGGTAEEKQSVEAARAQFQAQILGRPELVDLADRAGGPVTRYTTRAVLEAEIQVLQAAGELAVSDAHHVSDGARAAILGGVRYQGITKEQVNAFRHVTGAEGIALIDGQAGTGKSFTIAAVREAYEAAGCRVIGLGPTNAVAQDMQADGFGHAVTIHSELFALNNGRRSWDAKTVVVVDEAAMLDTKLMAMVTAHTAAAGAKLILVGDDRQLSSIDRGGMFGALKDRHGAAELSEVKRQHKNDERRAAEMMAEGNFHDALGIYDRKGAIRWTRTQGEARAALLDQWATDSAAHPEKSRFVFAYTNADVATLNAGLRALRKGRGELGEDHELDTAHGRLAFAAGDRVQFTATDKKAGIVNGSAGTIAKIEGSEITVKLDGRKPVTITFSAATFDKFRHGYAGTIYRGQGRTLDQTYLYHSEHWRSAASYVALTRHRDKAELFAARNTAADVKQLARQMARIDERRAASQFHYAPEITAAPLTAAALHARFSAEAIPPKGPDTQPKDGAAQRKIQPEPPQPLAPAPIYGVSDSRKRRKMAIEREDATDPAAIKRQIADQQDLAAQAKEQTELSERLLAGVRSAQEEGDRIKAAEAAAGQKAAQDDDIADARSRYAQAAGERYDIRRPYSSLSEVVGLEGAMFQREQEKLRREAAVEQNPEKRELIELRRQIEANDYMAITSDRLAAMSRVITGNSNSEESQRQEQRADYFAAEALELRRQRQELQDRPREREKAREAEAINQRGGGGTGAATGQDNQPAPEAAQQAAQAHEAARPAPAPGRQPERPVGEAERPAEVIYFGPSAPERAAEPPTRETTDERQAESTTAENTEITDSKAAKKAALAQMRAETEQSIAQGQERGHGHSR